MSALPLFSAPEAAPSAVYVDSLNLSIFAEPHGSPRKYLWKNGLLSFWHFPSQSGNVDAMGIGNQLQPHDLKQSMRGRMR